MGSRGSTPGWTLLKIVGLLVAVPSMIGFGLCSVFGFAIAAESDDLGLILGLALLGAGCTILCGWGVMTIIQRARREPEQTP